MTDYLFVDLETGGLKAEKHPILQLAAVVTNSDLEPRAYFMTYINPEDMECDPKALEVNRLNLTFLKQQIGEAQAMSAFFNWLPHRRMKWAGYNAPFDIGFIRAAEKRTGISIPFIEPAVDILKICRAELNLCSYKLDDVREHFGISKAGSHDAMKDIMDTIQIARKIKKKVSEMPVLRYAPPVEQIKLEAVAPR